MSVTLWLDTPAEKTLELGPTLPVYEAFARMAHAAGDAWQGRYSALSGVLMQCETQEDADPAWLADARRQAGLFLREYGASLNPSARDLLTLLAGASS